MGLDIDIYAIPLELYKQCERFFIAYNKCESFSFHNDYFETKWYAFFDKNVNDRIFALNEKLAIPDPRFSHTFAFRLSALLNLSWFIEDFNWQGRLLKKVWKVANHLNRFFKPRLKPFCIGSLNIDVTHENEYEIFWKLFGIEGEEVFFAPTWTLTRQFTQRFLDKYKDNVEFTEFGTELLAFCQKILNATDKIGLIEMSW